MNEKDPGVRTAEIPPKAVRSRPGSKFQSHKQPDVSAHCVQVREYQDESNPPFRVWRAAIIGAEPRPGG